jgi:hypothetical protein
MLLLGTGLIGLAGLKWKLRRLNLEAGAE